SVDGQAVFSGQHSQPPDVVGVLMGDKHPVYLSSRAIDGAQAFLHPLSADAGVDQQAGGIAPHINAVSAASAGDTTHSHKSSSSAPVVWRCRKNPRCCPGQNSSVSGTPPREAGWPAFRQSSHRNIPGSFSAVPVSPLLLHKHTTIHHRFHHIFLQSAGRPPETGTYLPGSWPDLPPP